MPLAPITERSSRCHITRAEPVGIRDSSTLSNAGPVFEPWSPAATASSRSPKRPLQPSWWRMKPKLPARNRVPTRLKECDSSCGPVALPKRSHVWPRKRCCPSAKVQSRSAMRMRG
jgi:hypothetical protein